MNEFPKELRRLTLSLRSLMLLAFTLSGAMSVWFGWEPWRPAFLSHGEVVKTATLSPDGRYVASYSPKKGISIWSAESGTRLHTIEEIGPVDSDFSLCWTSDSALLCFHASHSRSDDSNAGPFLLFCPDTGRRLATLHDPNSAFRPTFSLNGSRLFTGTRLWDSRDGSLVADLKSKPYCFAFSPHAQTVACARKDTIQFWNTETGRLNWEAPITQDTWVHELTFSTESHIVSFEQRRPIYNGVDTKEFMDLAERLGDSGDAMRYWYEYRRERDATSGKLVVEELRGEGLQPYVMDFPGPEIWCQTVSPDKQRKVREHNKRLVIADIVTNQTLTVLRGMSRPGCEHFEFSQDGTRLLGVDLFTENPLVVWKRVYPERWLGLLAIPQFWLTMAFAGGFVISLRQDRSLLGYKNWRKESNTPQQAVPARAT